MDHYVRMTMDWTDGRTGGTGKEGTQERKKQEEQERKQGGSKSRKVMLRPIDPTPSQYPREGKQLQFYWPETAQVMLVVVT
jgi:hypothetical protein